MLSSICDKRHYIGYALLIYLLLQKREPFFPEIYSVNQPVIANNIGKELGIIGPDVVPPDYSTVKPKLTAIVAAGAATIKFDKGEMEGVKIYSKRGSETHFTFLGTDTHSPYHDNRPKLAADSPEERQYYAFYSEDDSDVGIQSDVVSIVIP